MCWGGKSETEGHSLEKWRWERGRGGLGWPYSSEGCLAPVGGMESVTAGAGAVELFGWLLEVILSWCCCVASAAVADF